MAQMPDDELEPLITQCPSCGTRFRVAEPQLERARGRVRCGACLTVFHGIEHLVVDSIHAAADDEQAQQTLDDLLDELAGEQPLAGTAAPPTLEALPQRRPPPSAPPPAPAASRRPALFGGFEEPADEADGTSHVRSDAAETPRPAPGRDTVPPPAPAKADPPAAESVAEPVAPASVPASVEAPPPLGVTPASATPRPARRASDRRRAEPMASEVPAPVTFGEPRVRQPRVWAGIAAGVVLLVAQVLWYQFDDWAVEPGWRALYTPICGVIGCELPVLEDQSQISTRNLVVRIHPSEPAALLVNAVIVNQAEFAQPFPVLELKFTTVRGNLVAARRFEPEQYLAGDARGMALIPPRTPVQIELTMDDPGPAAVNYHLSLR